MKASLRKVWLVAVSVLFMLCISLFAACGAKNYTLTFVTNGGTEIAPITAEAGAEITPPADPEKAVSALTVGFSRPIFRAIR